MLTLVCTLSCSCSLTHAFSLPLSRSLDTGKRDLCARDLCAVCDRCRECRPPYVSQHLKVYCMYCGACLLDGTAHNVKRFSYLHAYSCVYSLLLVLSHSCVFPTSLSVPLSRSLDTVQRDLCAKDLFAICNRCLECRPPYVSQHLKVYCMYCGSCLLDGTAHNVKRFSYQQSVSLCGYWATRQLYLV